MNKQRKVLITTTYNEMGIIIDTKAEELTQPNLQPTCNNLATDTISRQAAIDALHMHLMYRMGTDSNKKRLDEWINNLPSAKPERKKGEWIPVTNGRGGFECDQCHNYAPSYQDGVEWLSGFCPNCGADMRGEQDE